MVNWTSCQVDGVPTVKCLEPLFSSLLSAVAGLVFVVLLFMFITASITWLTAGDSPEKLKKAQGTFMSALLGMIIIASAYLIINILGSFLGLDNLGVFTIPD